MGNLCGRCLNFFTRRKTKKRVNYYPTEYDTDVVQFENLVDDDDLDRGSFVTDEERQLVRQGCLNVLTVNQQSKDVIIDAQLANQEAVLAEVEEAKFSQERILLGDISPCSTGEKSRFIDSQNSVLHCELFSTQNLGKSEEEVFSGFSGSTSPAHIIPLDVSITSQMSDGDAHPQMCQHQSDSASPTLPIATSSQQPTQSGWQDQFFIIDE